MTANKEKIKEWGAIAGIVLVTLLIAYFMVLAELSKRAKREYLEGEKYYNFHKNPETKKQYFDGLLAEKKMSKPEYEMAMEDNSLKNAYIQYKTVVDLFTPPESKWVKKSRVRLKEVEPMYNAWVKQLKAGVAKAAK